MYTLISTLVSAGWTKVMDSDGTTYSAIGAQVTSGSSGANGLGNTNAWVRLQSPPTNGGTIVNQTREITIQRGTTDLVWRIKYSASALFAGGTPGISQTPLSTDEVFMIGGGTNASPTFGNLFATNQTYRWHVVCGGASESYSFVAWSFLAGGGTNTCTIIALDVMATGTYPATDVDPAVMIVDLNGNPFNFIFLNSGFGATTVTNPAVARGWLGATSAAGASTASNSVGMFMTGSSTFAKSGTIGTNPWTGNLDLFPQMWGSAVVSPKGIKGFSTLFRYACVTRNNMITCDVTGVNSKDRICVGQVWIPWDGSDPAQ